MILAAHQPQYLPYPGVIQKIARSDVFVLVDDVKYVKQEWQNRNRIRTLDGGRWLTIPVHSSSSSLICDVMPVDGSWLARHRRIVGHEYRRSDYLWRAEKIWEALADIRCSQLSVISCRALQVVLDILRISTPIVLESELCLSRAEVATKDLRHQNLCRRLGCSQYLSGDGARAYVDERSWRRSDISLCWQCYEPMEYEQLHPGWVPNVSVLDLLLCVAKPEELIQPPRR